MRAGAAPGGASAGAAGLAEAVGEAPSHAGVVRHNGWTAARKVRFLHYLSERGDVRAAAARVGMSRQSAYVLRRRDGVFAQGWSAALVVARGYAEEILANRALDGVEEPVFYHGEEVARRRRFDGRLLLAHLARLDRLAETPFAASGMGECAGDLAARFDEVLGMMMGALPEPEMVQVSAHADDPDPVLPLTREVFADRHAQAQPDGDWADWLAAWKRGEAQMEEEPEPPYPQHFAQGAARWDIWHTRALGAVDGALAGPGGEWTSDRVTCVNLAGTDAPQGCGGQGGYAASGCSSVSRANVASQCSPI